jgi:hypothetical protein
MRFCLCLLTVAVTALCAADTATESIKLHGKLELRSGQQATLETADHKRITLDGDEPTTKVMADARVNGFDIEVKGHFTAPARFLIDPMRTHSMLVQKDSGLKMVTYWCDVCSIRTYAPGRCVCCLQETTLDLRDPSEKNNE